MDAMRIEWRYEPEGYDLGAHGWYLPDFWLPQVKMFAEVKPYKFARYEDEIEKLAELVRRTGHDVCLFWDTPDHDQVFYLTGHYQYGELVSAEVARDDLLFSERPRWLDEGRFFSSSGCETNNFPWPGKTDYTEQAHEWQHAAAKAMSAQFTSDAWSI